jgi:hypothetical protein
MFGRQRQLAGERVHAGIAQGGCHEGEIVAGDLHRTLSEIIFQRQHRITLDDAEIHQHPGNGAVARSGCTFGTVDRLVYGYLAPDKPAEGLFNQLPLGLRTGGSHQTGGCDCASIDHRVQRRTGLRIQTDGIERFATGLDPHVGGNLLPTTCSQRSGINKGFGNRLNGKKFFSITDAIRHPIHGDHTNTERVRVNQ